MPNPRAWTMEEIQAKVVSHVAELAKYWATLVDVPDAPPLTIQRRCDGLAFSILAMLDGSSAGLPAFIVAPDPHPDDREYNKLNGGKLVS